MERRKSLRSKRPLQRDDSPAESNDGELSSGSHGSSRSRQTSPKKLKRAMKKELIQKFNWKCNPQRIAKLVRRRISILDAVEVILKFPAGELDVEMPPAGNPRDKGFMKLDKFRSEKAERGQSLAQEEELLLTYTDADDKDKFWLSFIEVLLCCYLAPTTSNLINRSYVLGALSDLTKIPMMNWCRFAVKYLIRDIKEIRAKTVENINLQGCLHILIVMYADLVKKSHIVILEGKPRIRFINNEMLEDLESNCRKRKIIFHIPVVLVAPNTLLY